MLFNKSFVSFVAAIALATSVAAAATPNTNSNTPSTGGQDQSTGGDKQVKVQNVVPTCSTGNPTCCGSTAPFSSLTQPQQAELHSLDPNVNEGLNVGENCVTAGSQGCGNNLPLCCDAIQSAVAATGCLKKSRE
ncbi:hypothetical protein EI94DRAFT_1700468 [Lactarius quietus]|nr:hypothetical protein EI94DRAFT_1700468 [Lactarius quietus]